MRPPSLHGRSNGLRGQLRQESYRLESGGREGLAAIVMGVRGLTGRASGYRSSALLCYEWPRNVGDSPVRKTVIC